MFGPEGELDGVGRIGRLDGEVARVWMGLDVRVWSLVGFIR